MRLTKLPSSKTSSVRTTTRSRACARAAWASGPSRRPISARTEDHLRVRAVRHRRRLRADHLPPAACMGRARPAGGGSDVESLHGSGRLPELAGVLGSHRSSVLPQRAAPLHGDDNVDSNLMLALARPGASGDQGVYADRIELEGITPRFPLPDFSPRTSARGLGLRPNRRNPAAHQLGRYPRRRVRSSPETPPGGDGTSARNLKAAASDVLRLMFIVGEGVQNEMNDSPVDIGIANNPGDPVRPVVGEAIPIVAHQRSSITPGTSNSPARSATRGRTTTTPMLRLPTPSSVALRARQPPLHAGAERDVRRRAAVGPSRELLRRLPERRLQDPVLVQIQLLVEAWRLVMTRRIGPFRSASAPWHCSCAGGAASAGGAGSR